MRLPRGTHACVRCAAHTPSLEQFLLLTLGERALRVVPTAVEQFAPYRSPGQSERARGAGGACDGEHCGDRQHLTRAKGCTSDEERRDEKAANGPPRRKAWKRHLIKPATPLGQHEEPGECDPGNKAESTEEDRERQVGFDAQHPTWHEANSKPGCCPSKSHPDCTANASQQTPHDLLRPSAPRLLNRCLKSNAKPFVLQSNKAGRQDSSARIARTMMKTPKEECEELLSSAMPFAELMLSQHREFYPFGQAMAADGQIMALGADTGDDHPASREMIALLEKGLQEG